MAGIFQSNGVWTCGFDFFPSGSNVITAGGVFDTVGPNWIVDPAYARFSGKGAKASGGTALGRTLGTNLATVIKGIAFLTPSLPSSGYAGLAAFYDASTGNPQVGLAYNSSGQFQFVQTNPLNVFTAPSGPIGSPSAAGLVVPNSYMFLEFLVTIASSGGQLTLMVNGTQAITFTGNTKQTANAWTSQIQFGLGSAAGVSFHQFDDLYLLDTTGPSPLNTFLGPVRVQTDGPNADSATAGLNQWAFTTPQGSDFANAANIPPNAAQYNSDGNVGDRMSFRFPALTSKVYALNMWYSAEEDAAGTRGLVGIYRNNGIDQVGPAPGNLTASYVYYNQPATLDPNTGQPWTSGPQGAVNTCELGLKVNS